MLRRYRTTFTTLPVYGFMLTGNPVFGYMLGWSVIGIEYVPVKKVDHSPMRHPHEFIPRLVIPKKVGFTSRSTGRQFNTTHLLRSQTQNKQSRMNTRHGHAGRHIAMQTRRK